MNGQVIGLLTFALDGYYYGKVIKSLERETKKRGDRLVVIGTNGDHFANIVALDVVDVWVLAMHAVDASIVNEIKLRNKPIIGLNTWLDCDFQISINNDLIMRTIIDHLNSHHYTNIGYIGGQLYRDGFERLQAFKQYTKTADRFIFDSKEDNLADIATIIASNHKHLDAIVCATDFIAAGVINHFKKHQIRVPEDIALMSIDDIAAAQSNQHSLSTMHIRFNQMGLKIMESIDYYHTHQRFPDKPVYLESYPIFRKSCGCDWHHEHVGLKNPIETIDYLTMMIDRNFNLGQLLQFSNTDALLSMQWLSHTPIRRGFLGLYEQDKLKLDAFRCFDLESDLLPKHQSLPSTDARSFPSKELLFDAQYMGESNTLVIIPIVQEHHTIGLFGFVGTDHISAELMPMHTTYQLASFFAAGYTRAKLEEQSKHYNEQLELISDIIYDGVWEYHEFGDAITCRGGIVEHFIPHATTAQFSSDQFIRFIQPQDRLTFLHALKMIQQKTKRFHIELQLTTRKRQPIWIELTGEMSYDRSKQLVGMGSIRDVTAQKRANQRINELAYHDYLTGLSNRVSFERHLDETLAIHQSDTLALGLLLFDLDRFKNINDSYGHHVGDHLLRAVTKRIKQILPENSLFARLGGDEFVIVLSNLPSIDFAYQLGTKIIAKINQPFYHEDKQLLISTSIGISVYPEHCQTSEMLLQTADIAMYSAKREGRNRVHVFSTEIQAENATQIELENHLRQAIKYDELEVYFQPIYDVKTEKIISAEALLRWHSNKFGNVSPAVFIPIAEESGLIVDIGEWVIKESIRLKQQFFDLHHPDLKIFINLSSRQINHPQFIDHLTLILQEHKVNPYDYGFEVTETMMFDNIHYGKKILQTMKDLGLTLSMDDFGTGYSSLSTLEELPVQKIKIDKSFIDDIDQKPSKQTILKAIIDMAHALDLKVVAEGIETREQKNLMQALNVDLIQGYYYAKPLPATDFLLHLEEKMAFE